MKIIYTRLIISNEPLVSRPLSTLPQEFGEETSDMNTDGCAKMNSHNLQHPLVSGNDGGAVESSKECFRKAENERRETREDIENIENEPSSY